MVCALDLPSSLEDEHTADDHPHFLESATKLAAALRHTIFVDQVCARVILFPSEMNYT